MNWIISSFETPLTEVKGWCEVLPDMQELVVKDLEQDTNDVAAKDDWNKIGHRTGVVDRWNIGHATKCNTENVFSKENDVTNCLSVEAFLFLFSKRFLIVQGNMDKVVGENICQTIHEAHVKESSNEANVNG